MPPLAILVAAYFDRLIQTAPTANLRARLRRDFRLALMVGGAVAWFVAPPALDAKGASDWVVKARRARPARLGLALGLALSKRNAGALFGATAGGYALCFMVGMALVSQIAVGITTKPLIAQIAPGVGPQTEILAVGFSQSLPFYTGKRMRVMGTPDELRHAKARLPAAERERWFFQIAPDLRRLMSANHPVYCVIRRNNYLGYAQRSALALLDSDAQKIASNDRFIIVGNAAAARLTPPLATGEWDELQREVAAARRR